jgi:glycosyltransferase involved in cell wall biosynthesis
MTKPRVLMFAYACDPRGTGEHWLGWGWAEQAARSFAVDLITTPKARVAVEECSRPLGITPHFVEAPATVRKLTELAGGSWWRKLAWQKRAFRVARQLHARNTFALAHQTTFHTFRVPFLAAGLGIPSVWGPIAGGEHVPPGFESYLGRARYSESSRQLVNRFWLRHPAVKRSLRQAGVLFVSNRTTLEFLPPDCHAKARLVTPNALRAQDEQYVRPPVVARAENAPFKLLYVGNCVATRAIPLVLDALRESGLTHYEFTIIGGGPALESWKKRAQQMGLGAEVRFLGKIPHAELNGHYAGADVLVFPALRDSGGSALLEAMARYLPVICLDWGGPGEMLDEQSGIKVPVSTPGETVRAFGAALKTLQQDPGLRAKLADAARARAERLFGWQAKRQLLEATYNSLLQP